MVGVVVAESFEEDGRTYAHVALGGVIHVKADASYGAITPGDALITSPTPGHAMLAVSPVGGVVAAKALEGLLHGRGTIMALVE